jgi:hypothetical protein
MAKCTGNFDPDKSLYVIEEELYVNEADEIIEFLTWMTENDLALGRRNYQERFEQFKQSKKK